MARKVQPRPDASEVEANSIEHIAFSLEAVAARLRGAIGKADAWRALSWAADELERIQVDARDIGDEARTDEAANG